MSRARILFELLKRFVVLAVTKSGCMFYEIKTGTQPIKSISMFEKQKKTCYYFTFNI